ncbi:unnamed protein product [Linum tenue]|uniref:Uncharacterized protein n=1 Tax=Linum tenue TaxID=586396 RepID=A0AAV0KMD1_9ROSI|nr:unnamed protein product [Linum tenue]
MREVGGMFCDQTPGESAPRHLQRQASPRLRHGSDEDQELCSPRRRLRQKGLHCYLGLCSWYFPIYHSPKK